AKASRYVTNADIRNQYNFEPISETYKKASERLATTLATHPNIDAINIIINPYNPLRIERPRYKCQLIEHIEPHKRKLIEDFPDI
ncbi:hypothetical protein KR059_003691, partial [Drosophila kikkawai]